MKRRWFLSLPLCRLFAAGRLVRVDVTDAATGEGFVPNTRVLLDGVDVSERCYRAERYSNGSSESGNVFLYKRNEKGNFYVDPETREVAREFRSGHVEIIRP